LTFQDGNKESADKRPEVSIEKEHEPWELEILEPESQRTQIWEATKATNPHIGSRSRKKTPKMKLRRG
jgi:hypothetical protein